MFYHQTYTTLIWKHRALDLAQNNSMYYGKNLFVCDVRTTGRTRFDVSVIEDKSVMCSII